MKYSLPFNCPIFCKSNAAGLIFLSKPIKTKVLGKHNDTCNRKPEKEIKNLHTYIHSFLSSDKKNVITNFVETTKSLPKGWEYANLGRCWDDCSKEKK